MLRSKPQRRARLRSQPFPEDWLHILDSTVPYYRFLPPEDQTELQGHVRVLLAEKNFEGCGGLELTDEIRVTIAAYACVLLLHRETDYFSRLVTILVYPHAFVAEVTKRGPGKWTIKGEETRVGESWKYGVVILAWDDVKFSIANPDDGHNVIFHEFAHQLDAENGAPDGFPLVEDAEVADEWSEVFTEAYDLFRHDLELHCDTLIDPYGAENPSEFFAVVTETFFELPHDLQNEHPKLYDALKHYFRQDPAQLLPRIDDSTQNDL
jgi:Mlc titration factor MtfA (ptsG expression regulator)